MTPSELRYNIEGTEENSYFFSRKTMQFFGDTMRNFGVRQTVVIASFDAEGDYHEQGVEREVYELYRKQPVKHGLSKSHYFDRNTFKSVYPK